MKKISSLFVLICAFVNIIFAQSITSFTPQSGPVGTTVTLTGSFNSVLEKNIVYFGNVKANLISGTTSSIKVEVPAGASTNPITVGYNNKISSTMAVFTTTFTSTYSTIDSLMFNDFSMLKLGYEPSCFASGDFDNDGFIDIAVASNNESMIRIYKNMNYVPGRIDPSLFQPVVNLNASSSISALKIADVNADGKLDIFCLNEINNTFSVFKNVCLNGILSQNSFDLKIDFPTGKTPKAICIADINSDLKLDVLVANYNDQNISVYQNKTSYGIFSKNTFISSFNLSVGDQPVDVLVGTNVYNSPDKFNLNRSNNYIFVANYNNQSVSIFKLREILGSLPNGLNDTCYTAIDLLLTDSEPSSIAVEDLNSDGTKELIVCNNQSAKLTVYNGFSTTGVYTAYSNNLPNAVKICDLNGDGKLEIININTSDNNISIFQNKSTLGSKFTVSTILSKVNLQQGLGTKDLICSDFDNDGKVDLITLDVIDNQISFRRNVSGGAIVVTGKLKENILKTNKSSTVQSVKVKGLNVKSNTITVTPSGYTVQISLDSLTGYSATPIVLNPLADSVATTKIFVKVVGGTTQICSTGIITFTCTNALKQIVKFGIKSGIPVLDSIYPSKAFIGDTVRLKGINFGTNILKTKIDFGGVKAKVVAVNDTIITVVVPSGATNNRVLANISGLQTETKNIFYPIFLNGDFLNKYCFTGPHDYKVATYPSNLTIADFNEDGKQDIICNVSGGFTMLTNKTTNNRVDSSFKVNNSYVGNFTQLLQNDLDGDGKSDLITNSSSTNFWNIFRNKQNSDSITALNNFESIVNLKSLGSNEGVYTTDINNDGKFDLLIANNGKASSDGNVISVYLNKAVSGKLDTNSFSKPFYLVTEDNPSIIYSGDLNNDLKSEIIIGNKNGALTVFSNNFTLGTINSSSFGSPFQIIAKDLPSDLEIFDINNDGKNDIVLISANGNILQIFINKNNQLTESSFDAAINFDLPGTPIAFEIKDFDGDARPDITVANYNQNSVSLFKNVFDNGIFSSSSFQEKVDYTVGISPYDVKVVDIDGDGKPEIVVANNGSLGAGGIKDPTYSTISVLRNRVVPNAVGIANDLVETQFDLYPNPASKSFNVKVTESDKIETVELLELNGNKVLTLNNINTDSIVVDIETISSGMYLVKVITSNGVGIKKLLIQ